MGRDPARSGAIRDAPDSLVPGAVRATVERAVRLDAVADDPAAAMGADRRELLDGAFEAVEDMPVSGGHDLEREVIVVAAHFADRHGASRVGAGSVAARPLECPLDRRGAS